MIVNIFYLQKLILEITMRGESAENGKYVITFNFQPIKTLSTKLTAIPVD